MHTREPKHKKKEEEEQEEEAEDRSVCLNVYLAARNTLRSSHVRIEIMSSKESIVS